MEKPDEIQNVKGKEFVAARILFLVAVFVFIVPIVLVLFLKFLYHLTQATKAQINHPVIAESQLERVYSNN